MGHTRLCANLQNMTHTSTASLCTSKIEHGTCMGTLCGVASTARLVRLAGWLHA